MQSPEVLLSSIRVVTEVDVSALRSVVERFVAAAADPAVLDPGEEPLRLAPNQWTLSEWSGRLVLEAWDGNRNLVRKITAIKTGINAERRGQLSLLTERFPKLQGELRIADLAAPSGQDLSRRSSRIAFRDRFRLMLAREFPEWRVDEVSSEPNLEESLSPAFVRAFLRWGSAGIAVMAAPPDCADCASAVTFGLIWLDHVRRREKRLTVDRLLLYTPAGRDAEVAYRAGLINPTRVSCRLYVYDERDRAAEVDFADAGNVESTLPPCRRPAAPNAAPFEMPGLDGVERVEQSDGSCSFRVRGLEFARWTPAGLKCGVGRKRAATVETAISLARELARVRSDAPENRGAPLYTECPEGWLESQVRADPQSIDASLLPAPLYGQAPVFGAADRGVVDILGVEHTGRLVVVELKASADLQLPFQALDYWLRVRKHLMAGDFERLGYFPGIRLLRESPRILLVAPALEFHSTSEGLLSYLSPHIEVTRVGLAAGWRSELRVMFRLRGAEKPAANIIK